uniref:Uncharacterized protein n=2 Tax=Spironucleus salmonicida TaxID=348837 RepID=V6LNP7_9EUKA|eukprot:EST46220.1 Hypothetical protein SS50377_13815 [Spironucleus salmonicida]
MSIINKIYDIAQQNFIQELKVQLFDNLYYIFQYLQESVKNKRIYNNFIIFQMDINPDNSLQVGKIITEFIKQEYEQAIYVNSQIQQIQENQIIIIDDIDLLYCLIEQIHHQVINNITIITISSLLPKLIQTSIYNNLAQFYEQQNYFPISEFKSFTFQGSFKFDDVIQLLIQRTTLSLQFLQKSNNLPLYQAQFYANDVKQSLNKNFPAPSIYQQNVYKFMIDIEKQSQVVFRKLEVLLFLEGEKYDFDLSKLVNNESNCGDVKVIYNNIFGDKITKQINIGMALKMIKAKYQKSSNQLIFENFGEQNFTNNTIQILVQNDRTKIGILFKCIQNMAFEHPIYDILLKYNELEGSKHMSKETLIQEFEEIISQLVELNIIGVEYKQNLVVVTRKF